MKKIKNKSNIKAWLLKAEDDLAFAKAAFKETDFNDHICFLAQQSVEKYLKAVIIKTKGNLQQKEKTHNLKYLAEICQKFDLDLSDFEKELRLLSEVYIPARYPAGEYLKFKREDAKKSIEIAEEIIRFIKENIDFSVYLI
ncbi:MAG: HEPN domain-containing protein [bacterium]|nr:HEPN domain-containing protein [bacterium]